MKAIVDYNGFSREEVSFFLLSAIAIQITKV
jgi:hypothetical protein